MVVLLWVSLEMLLKGIRRLKAHRQKLGRLDRRQQQRGENADDGDHHEQLDQREAHRQTSITNAQHSNFRPDPQQPA